jgi:hypothetical protein
VEVRAEVVGRRIMEGQEVVRVASVPPPLVQPHKTQSMERGMVIMAEQVVCRLERVVAVERVVGVKMV